MTSIEGVTDDFINFYDNSQVLLVIVVSSL